MGQKQRINMARAFLKNSPVLILDEPTASLDVRSEASIMSSIHSYSRETGSTILLITHRLSTIQNCDRILVLSEDLENGGSTVSEQGTHSEESGKKRDSTSLPSQAHYLWESGRERE